MGSASGLAMLHGSIKLLLDKSSTWRERPDGLRMGVQSGGSRLVRRPPPAVARQTSAEKADDRLAITTLKKRLIEA
jgi:hypothetical protein